MFTQFVTIKKAVSFVVILTDSLEIAKTIRKLRPLRLRKTALGNMWNEFVLLILKNPMYEK